MSASELGSTGADEMSVFHGLSAGNGRRPSRETPGPRPGPVLAEGPEGEDEEHPRTARSRTPRTPRTTLRYPLTADPNMVYPPLRRKLSRGCAEYRLAARLLSPQRPGPQLETVRMPANSRESPVESPCGNRP